MMPFTLRLSLAAAIATASLSAFAADTASFTGSFTRDQDIQFFRFVTGSGLTFSVKSFGYAGGTQADSNVVPDGGFDPLIVLYDDQGYLITSLQPAGLLNDDGDTKADLPTSVPIESDGTLVGISASSGLVLDPYWIEGSYGYGNLQSNTEYYLALIQATNNGADYLGNNFGWDALPGNPTDIFLCTNGKFCDFDGNNRTGQWALDFYGVASAATVTHDEINNLFPPPNYTIPELDVQAATGGVAIVMGGLLLAADLRRRKRR